MGGGNPPNSGAGDKNTLARIFVKTFPGLIFTQIKPGFLKQGALRGNREKTFFKGEIGL